jgi:CheY-like chemotaxis protein
MCEYPLLRRSHHESPWIREAAMDRSSQPHAIVIVDDEPDILALLKLFTRNLAPTYDILAVSDSDRALAYLAGRVVPLLITDYMMPGMNGLELATAAKAISPTTYVIMVTAYGSVALEQRARAQLVDTFLPKADVFDRLEGVMRSVLRLAPAQE